MDENKCATCEGGGIEELAVSQQNVESYTRSNDELVIEMQRTYDEQQSNMGEMIRQVALLTEMIKEIKEIRAKSEVTENIGKEEGAIEAEEEEPADTEQESEALREEMESVKVELVGKEILTGEKSITTPPENGAQQEIPEEAHDEPHKEEEEVIKRDVEINNTLFYPQSEKAQVPNEKVKNSTNVVGEEKVLMERPPPVIAKSEGCCYDKEESEPRRNEERWRRKAARLIYGVPLQLWPEPLKMRKPTNPGLRPKENKKVQGTYRHHRKKRGMT